MGRLSGKGETKHRVVCGLCLTLLRVRVRKYLFLPLFPFLF